MTFINRLFKFLVIFFFLLFLVFLYSSYPTFLCRRKGDQCEQPALLKCILDCLKAVHHAFNVSSFILSTLSLESPPLSSSDSSSFHLSLSPFSSEKNKINNNNNNYNNNNNDSNNTNNNNNGINRNRSFQNPDNSDLHQNTVLIEDSLRLLLRMWNCTPENNGNEDDNCNSKNNNSYGNVKKSVNGGFVRDLAFIQTAEIILKQIGSVETMFESENKPYLFQNSEIKNHPTTNKSSENNENISDFTAGNKQIAENREEYGNSEKHVSYSVIPISVFSASKRLKVLVERIIQKLLSGMLSDHCKVSPLCISIVEKNAILLKYFVTITEENNGNNSENDSNEDDDYNSGYERDTIEPVPKIPQKVEKLSEKVMEWKRNKFEKLVEILRKNRNHWHPQVKIASGKLFDTLLNYLE
jgi:hypothetical protein